MSVFRVGFKYSTIEPAVLGHEFRVFLAMGDLAALATAASTASPGEELLLQLGDPPLARSILGCPNDTRAGGDPWVEETI